MSVLFSSTNSPLKSRGIFEHESFSTNAHVIACTPFETPSSRVYPPDASRLKAMITWNESIPTRALKMRVASPGVSHTRSVKPAFYLRLDSLARGEIVGHKGIQRHRSSVSMPMEMRVFSRKDARHGRSARIVGNRNVAAAMSSLFDILRHIWTPLCILGLQTSQDNSIDSSLGRA